MQIHELNNFTGTLGSGAYLAIDDGTDTGKISSQGLLAATEARIDNIIAGPAPSAEEIVDARLGADGVTYPSLGDAIRDQFTDVKSALDQSVAIFESALDQSVAIFEEDLIKSEEKNNIKLDRLHNTISQQYMREIDLRTNSIERLTEFYIVDNNGNHLKDVNNDILAGLMYLPILDDTFKSEVYPPSVKAIISYVGKTFLSGIADINYMGLNNIPILYIDNMPQALLDFKATKSSGTATEATYRFPMFGIEGKLSKVKIQGNSSQTFPKKNYTLTFDNNFKFVDSWGYHKKYVIKSNFNDFTQARNVCGAKIWGDIRKNRDTYEIKTFVDEDGYHLINNTNDYLCGIVDPQLSSGINCGAVDGFPILVFINGEYWGLYCFNTPKDDFMANMGSGERECILSADYSLTQANYFKGLATMEEDANGYLDFEVEYASDDFSDSDILESLNTMLAKVLNTHSNYVEELSPYIDFGSAIDYYILCAVIDNIDGIGKNYLLQTWDGIKWYFCAYDMDMIMGNINSRGNVYGSATGGRSFKQLEQMHRMFHIIYTYCKDELIARYRYLRSTTLSEDNVDTVFGEFINNIPKNAYDYETKLWPQTTGTSIKTFDQICNWYRLRMQYLDNEIEALDNEISN